MKIAWPMVFVLLISGLSLGSDRVEKNRLEQARDEPGLLHNPSAGEQINWWVLGSGGSSAASTNYVINGTVGQTAVGISNSTNYRVSHGFWQSSESAGCCSGRVGDANGVGGDDPTIGDVSLMIDALFITASETPLITPPACIEEADVNLSSQNVPSHWPPLYGDITIGDISALIDALFITADLSILPNCP